MEHLSGFYTRVLRHGLRTSAVDWLSEKMLAAHAIPER
jgi:hypothetical protein